MSSSEDDRPLAARASAAAPKAEPASAAKAGPVAPPPKRAIDDSSEDDAPLAARAKPAAKKPAAAKPKPAPKPRTKPAAAASTPAVKKERKTFDLPGQTREPPPESDSLRAFYESLLKQNPDSAMAAKFCVQHGLLPRAEADAWVAANGRGAAAARSPVKRSSGSARKPAAKARPSGKTARKRAATESESEDEASSDSDAPLAKRAKAPPAAKERVSSAKKRTPPAAAVKKATPVSRDVAFGDGGLDAGSSSDDDVPLAARAAKA